MSSYRKKVVEYTFERANLLLNGPGRIHASVFLVCKMQRGPCKMSWSCSLHYTHRSEPLLTAWLLL